MCQSLESFVKIGIFESAFLTIWKPPVMGFFFIPRSDRTFRMGIRSFLNSPKIRKVEDFWEDSQTLRIFSKIFDFANFWTFQKWTNRHFRLERGIKKKPIKQLTFKNVQKRVQNDGSQNDGSHQPLWNDWNDWPHHEHSAKQEPESSTVKREPESSTVKNCAKQEPESSTVKQER